ncbi:helix-turn-helix domain-containing protein [Loktanella sp. DJP18]|uniref:helix-turn-helix domain-containing protein n=1 Tax=Loktanella sp. DJP18 TaxID=3409788 RepID=UPI003BB67197
MKHPAASALLHLLVANVGDGNAVVASHKVLARLMGSSPSTVKRAMSTLADGNWIEVQQIGANGTVNAYVLNSRVAWAEGRDRLRYARLQAEVLLAEDEQAAGELDKDKNALHHLPRIGELQIPAGAGLPPTSQPSFPGMEADLPATGSD